MVYRCYKRGITGLLFLLSAPGCSLPKIDETPQRIDCNPVTRYFPLDKVYYTPWAFGKGMYATGRYIGHSRKHVAIKIIQAPFVILTGTLNSTIDMAINLASWIPLEFSEGVTGKTWEVPYIPFSFYMLKESEIEDEIKKDESDLEKAKEDFRKKWGVDPNET